MSGFHGDAVTLAGGPSLCGEGWDSPRDLRGGLHLDPESTEQVEELIFSKAGTVFMTLPDAHPAPTTGSPGGHMRG